MNVRRSSRSLIAAGIAALALTACGTSPPPANELAKEMIDTLEVAKDPKVKDCMYKVVDEFTLSDEDAQGFDNLDDVADKAADGQARAIEIMNRFEADLAACNPENG